MLFSRDYWRTTIFVSVFWFCAVTPYFAIATFAASVLADYGLGDGLVGALGVNGLALVGVLVSVLPHRTHRPPQADHPARSGCAPPSC